MSELRAGLVNATSMNADVHIPGHVVQANTVTIGPTHQTISSTDPQPIIGLEVIITPKFANSEILVISSIASSSTYVSSFGIFRDDVATANTSAANNSNQNNMQLTVFEEANTTLTRMRQHTVVHSEAANNTEQRYYNVYATSGWNGTSYDLIINNRTSLDMASFSTLTVMEIAK